MYRSSREQAERKTKKQPADQRREKRAHSFGGPLRRLSGEERKQDNIDCPPQRQAKRGGRHCAIGSRSVPADWVRQGERVRCSQDRADGQA